MLLANCVVLFLCYRAGDENAEMAGQFVHGIDDRLSVRPDIVNALIEIRIQSSA